MANSLYTPAKVALMTGGFNLGSDSIRALPVDAGQYTVDLAAHDNLDDIPSGARSATAVALANKSTTGGVFDADDVTFPSVTASKVISAIVLYKHTGTESTSKLLAYCPVGSGLPLTATGADVVVAWDNGANKIFKL